MDLTLTDSEAAFKDEVRSWLEENHPGPAPEGDDHAEFEFRRAWQKKMHDAGWAGLSWPEEYGGKGATLIEQSIFNEELARQRVPRPGQRARPGHGRPCGDRARQRGPEGALPGADPLRRGDLVPGLLRARVRFGPRLAQDPRREGQRELEGHRPEGLDHLRARGEVLHAARPHRPGRPQAQGDHLLHPRHGSAERRRSAAPPDHRRGRVQRDLPRGGRDPRRERHRRGRRRLGGRDHHADVRARRPRRRRRDRD